MYASLGAIICIPDYVNQWLLFKLLYQIKFDFKFGVPDRWVNVLVSHSNVSEVYRNVCRQDKFLSY